MNRNCIRRMTVGRKARSWGRYDIISYRNTSHWQGVEFIMVRSISTWTRYDEYAHSFKIGHGNSIGWTTATSFTDWRMRE